LPFFEVKEGNAMNVNQDLADRRGITLSQLEKHKDEDDLLYPEDLAKRLSMNFK
jgi:hypothetical protein